MGFQTLLNNNNNATINIKPYLPQVEQWLRGFVTQIHPQIRGICYTNKQ